MKNKLVKFLAVILPILFILPMFNVVDSQAAAKYSRYFYGGAANSSDEGVYMNRSFIDTEIFFSGTSYSGMYYKVFYNDKQIYKSTPLSYSTDFIDCWFSSYNVSGYTTSDGYLKAGTYKIKVYNNKNTQIASSVSHVYTSTKTKGWVGKDGVWFYFKKAGQLASEEWVADGGKWYYIDYYGIMRKDGTYCIYDSKADKDEYYVFGADGALMYNSWYYDAKFNNWYYADASGKATTGWKSIGGKWYYFDDWGVMATGTVVTWDKDYTKYTSCYFMDTKTGAMVTNGWAGENICDEKGNVVWTEWYYLDGNGNAVTGWKNIGGTWYYFSQNYRYMYSDGIYNIDGKYYSFDKSGAMQTGWIYKWDTWYYADASGEMASGWRNINGTWYYFDYFGWMYHDGVYSINGTSYGFSSSGAMLTGWQYVGNAWRYFESSGAMARNKWIGNDYVDANGIWTKSK